MTHINQFTGGQYVNAADLAGRAHVVTIEGFTIEEFPAKTRDGKDYMKKKPVLKFAGKSKKLALNAINREAVAFLLGPILEEWIGKKITLVPDKTTFGSSTVDCVRVRPAEQPPQISSGATQTAPRNGGSDNFQTVERAGYKIMDTVRPLPKPEPDPAEMSDEIPF